MTLRGLKLEKVREEPKGVFEISTVVDAAVTHWMGERIATDHDFARLILIGLAVHNLTELQQYRKEIFVLTNDSPEDQPSPVDSLRTGFIRSHVFAYTEHVRVRSGFGRDSKFEHGLDFDNYLFHLEGLTFDFVDAYLGSRMPPTAYTFIMAPLGTTLDRVKNLVESSHDEHGFRKRMAELSGLISYGIEDLAYVFVTADLKLRRILLSIPPVTDGPNSA